MKMITVRWEVTEQHQEEFEVDDDFDPAVDTIDDSELAEAETGASWIATTERDIVEMSDV
jgi:hypothetical protein